MRPQKNFREKRYGAWPPAKMEVFRNWPTTETSVSENQSKRFARTGLSEIETCSGRGEREEPVLHDPALVEPIHIQPRESGSPRDQGHMGFSNSNWIFIVGLR